MANILLSLLLTYFTIKYNILLRDMSSQLFKAFIFYVIQVFSYKKYATTQHLLIR